MADVPVWPDCDRRCPFCSNPTSGYRARTAEHSLAALRRRLLAYKTGEGRFLKFNEARDNLTLTGGEPTLHPDFLPLLRFIRREFPRASLRLLTHGRRFSETSFSRRVLSAAGAPLEVAVNLGGPLSSLGPSLEGLRTLLRLRGSGQEVEARVVLTRTGLKSLPRLLGTLLKEGPPPDRLTLIFPEFEGHAERAFRSVGMRMGECAATLSSLKGLLSRFREARLYHFPLCALPPDLRPLSRRTLDPAKVVFALSCRDCGLRPRCVGIHKSYARRLGVREFLPESSRADGSVVE